MTHFFQGLHICADELGRFVKAYLAAGDAAQMLCVDFTSDGHTIRWEFSPTDEDDQRPDLTEDWHCDKCGAAASETLEVHEQEDGYICDECRELPEEDK